MTTIFVLVGITVLITFGICAALGMYSKPTPFDRYTAKRLHELRIERNLLNPNAENHLRR